MTGIKLLTTGSAVPDKIVTNDDLSKIVDTSDEWIVKRTGIRERRHCVEESHLDLASRAAGRALENAGIDRSKIAACVVTTVCADHFSPSCACLLQKELGLPEATVCFDMNAACAGFVYGLQVISSLLSEEKPYGLLVSAETLSRLTDFSDRSTCVLFGDGAGAALLKRCEVETGLCADFGARGDRDVLYVPTGVWREPHYLRMDGRAVFKFAVDIIPRALERVLAQAGKTMDDIDLVVMHQANERIIDHVARHMALPPEKCFKNIARYGNMSSACIPIALDDLRREGRLTPGTRLLVVGFGGGLTWGGAYLEVGKMALPST